MQLRHRKCLYIIVALLLVASFGIHLFEMHHDHPVIVFGEGDAVLHGADRKLFLAILFAASSILAERIIIVSKGRTVTFSEGVRYGIDHMRDSVQRALSQGIVHSRTF